MHTYFKCSTFSKKQIPTRYISINKKITWNQTIIFYSERKESNAITSNKCNKYLPVDNLTFMYITKAIK